MNEINGVKRDFYEGNELTAGTRDTAMFALRAVEGLIKGEGNAAGAALGRAAEQLSILGVTPDMHTADSTQEGVVQIGDALTAAQHIGGKALLLAEKAVAPGAPLEEIQDSVIGMRAMLGGELTPEEQERAVVPFQWNFPQ